MERDCAFYAWWDASICLVTEHFGISNGSPGNFGGSLDEHVSSRAKSRKPHVI